MTDRNGNAWENYEDSLFALLMTEAAEQEGQTLLNLNSKLKNNPAMEIPEELNQKCLAAIHHEFKTIRNKQRRKNLKKFGKKFAVVLIAATLATTVLCTAFPSLEVKLENLLINISDIATHISLGNGNTCEERENSPADSTSPYCELSSIPDGYRMERNRTFSSGSDCKYVNDHGGSIKILVVRANTSKLSLDTENAEVTDIEVLGYQGMLIEKGSRRTLFWNDTDKNVFVTIISDQLSNDEILRIAPDLQYNAIP